MPIHCLAIQLKSKDTAAESLSLDDRITISSMATEMGAVIILFSPSKEIIEYCSKHAANEFKAFYADEDANYFKIFQVDVAGFRPMVSRPGEPHDTVDISEV